MARGCIGGIGIRLERWIKQFPRLLWLVWLGTAAVLLLGLVSITTFNEHKHRGRPGYENEHNVAEKVDLNQEWAEWQGKEKHIAELVPKATTNVGVTKNATSKGVIFMSDVESWKPHLQPVSLDLKLSEEVLQQPSLHTQKGMFHQYGFNVNLSNHISLAHDWPDFRNEECKRRIYPPPSSMPKVSVIIIFYNEALSTLLRNVVAVLNRSPPELLGEVILVDDHSQMLEHKLLPEHLARLQARLPHGKVRLVHRNVHNGIVGARIRGAKEAIYPIIVFLDSHAEVCDGWLEPLAARIHEDRKRVVVPNIRGIDIQTLELIPGGTWPPSRGTFTWKLSFDIVLADSQLDVLEHDVDPKASATKTPVMPGGLFAMDREFFFEIGAYDPEIMYYGAEHIELSLRTWMCGGSMEIMPCSNVGHIYREFNRFGVDPQLGGVDIGHYLDRNDARVAEVWLDEYKDIFFTFRPKKNMDLGDLSDRIKLKRRVCPKPFHWFLTEVVRDHYVPDLHMRTNSVTFSDNLCLDCEARYEGPVVAKPCHSNSMTQHFDINSQGYIQTMAHYHHQLICVRVESVSQVPCDKAAKWVLGKDKLIRSLDRPGKCLQRGVTSGDSLKVRDCVASSSVPHQEWIYEMQTDAPHGGIIADPLKATCIDNMQKKEGAPGMYGCHGHGTQQWVFTDDKKIKSSMHGGNVGVCIGFNPVLRLKKCLKDDEDFKWKWRASGSGSRMLESVSVPGKCITHVGSSQELLLRSCEDANPDQLIGLASVS